MSALDKLKRRKIVQWGLTYLAGAWVVLQLVEILAGQFGWPAIAQQTVTIALGFGFFIALVVAWYHGEKGRQQVSGPEILMVAGILLVAGAAIAFVRGGGSAELDAGSAGPPGPGAGAGVPERSIAVLPLDDHSPAEEHAYFAGAMTEEITAALSKVPELKVTSRSSASKFDESGLTVREFALEELAVAHVLEGSVQRVGSEVRITVQLIDARTDEHLWSHTYDRELVDVLDVQVEIARAVADRLASSLTDREMDRIIAGMTDDAIAYDLYLRGLEAPDGSSAMALYRRAVEQDPEFPMAWAQIGIRYLFGSRSPAPERIDSARVAMDRAIELAEDSSYRRLLQAGRAVLLGGDRDQALARLREAVEANPGDALLSFNLALFYSAVGDLVEAVRYMRRGLALDPLSLRRLTLADYYARLGLYEAAEETLERALELAPDDAAVWQGWATLRTLQGRYEDALTAVDSMALRSRGGLLYRGRAHLWAGDFGSAHRAFEEAADAGVLDGQPVPFWLPEVAFARLMAGDSAGGREVLDRTEAALDAVLDAIHGRTLPESDDFIRLQIAAVRGDADAATRALREYHENGGTRAYRIQRSPLFAGARADPTFRAELDRLVDRIERMRQQAERILEGSP